MNTTAKTLRTVALAAATVALSACASTLTSSVDSAEHDRLDDYATYAWLDYDRSLGNTFAPEVVNPRNTQRIRLSIDEELYGKGYRKVSPDKADFIVTASIGANQRLRAREYFTGRGAGYYGGGFGGFNRFGSRLGRGFGGSQVAIDAYQEGVLVLDVFERSSREAVWHGAASKRLSKKTTAPKLIDEAVMTLLTEFPDKMS